MFGKNKRPTNEKLFNSYHFAVFSEKYLAK